MNISILDIREEAYEALGVTELPGCEHPHYEQSLKIIKGVLLRCLEGHSWYFARKRVTLSGNDGVFALPDDFLLLLWCSAKSYELLGRELRCFAGNCLEVLYISRSCVDALENNGVADLPAYFIECVVCKTSERLAVVVSGSMDKKLSLHKLYDVVLDEAKLVDVRQYASNGRVVAPLDAMMGVDGDFFPPTY